MRLKPWHNFLTVQAYDNRLRDSRHVKMLEQSKHFNSFHKFIEWLSFNLPTRRANTITNEFCINCLHDELIIQDAIP